MATGSSRHCFVADKVLVFILIFICIFQNVIHAILDIHFYICLSVYFFLSPTFVKGIVPNVEFSLASHEFII